MSILESKTIRSVLIIFLVCASLALLAVAVSVFSSLSATPTIANVPTITVSGEGTATAIPDIAQFSFTVDTTAATVAAAQDAASTLATKALAAMKNAGVADKDLQTTDYSISPHYTYSSQPTVCPLNGCPPIRQTLDGYEVSQTVSVKVQTASTTGQLLQAIGHLGITNVSGITFTQSDPNAVRDQARAQAIANAQQKAATLAQQLGVHLGMITNFQESNNTPRPLYYAAAAASTSASPTPPIPTGQNTVTDNVTITYEIQ